MTRQKKVAVGGLRSIATLQTLTRNAKPRERHQLANRYARLENERSRLEREIGIWETCRQTAANKLAKVRQEIDSLRPLLDEEPAKTAVCRNGRGQRRGPVATDVPGSSFVRSRTMRLDY